MWIGISYSHCNNESFGSFIIYSFIVGNTAANTDLGTLSAIDVDEGDTLTYTLENNSAAYFAIDGNSLKLAKTVDYETTKQSKPHCYFPRCR
jgi:hypothetical protein